MFFTPNFSRAQEVFLDMQIILIREKEKKREYVLGNRENKKSCVCPANISSYKISVCVCMSYV